MRYQDIYQQGIRYFQKDFEEVLPFIEAGEHVAMCSSLCTGEERFIEYVGFQLKKDKRYNIIQLNNTLIDIDELVKEVDVTKERNIILIPYFYRHEKFYTKILRLLYETFTNNEVVTLIKLGWNFYNEKSEYKDISLFLMNIIVRDPLNIDEVSESIQLRSNLHGWNIPKDKAKEILDLSGGLILLVKRILKYYSVNKDLNINELVKYPALELVLEGLAEMFENSNPDTLRKLGIIDQNNQIVSALLAKFIEKTEIAPKHELTGNSLALFNLMYQNRNGLVTDEMIDKIVRKGRSASLWANYKLVSRLKSHIKDSYNIRTVKGKGYVLSEK